MGGLQNRFRPESFDDFVGNKTVINSIKSIVQRPLDEQSRVWLFTGPPGTGKTSMGRLLRKIWGVSGFDYYEINSGNNRGIDTAREIINSLQYGPMSGKIKLFLLDEVHETTKEFKNAMLKPLEDTPEYIRFVLCTTNPEKLNIALTRCSTFSFGSQPPGNLKTLMVNVLKKLDKTVEDRILDNIASKSDGSPREALKMLDQIMDLKIEDIEGRLQEIQFSEVTGLEICRSLKNPTTWNDITNKILALKKHGNVVKLTEDIRTLILNYFNSCLLKSGNVYDAFVIASFENNFFNSGLSGFTLACHKSFLYFKGLQKERKG